MIYKVEFTKSALKELKKLDRSVSRVLLLWIDKNLEGTTNPREHGKGLVANRYSEWRYRVGKYRILSKIDDDKIIIEIIKVGLRNHVYKEKR